MSDEIENIEAVKSEHPSKLLVLVVLAASIAAVATPLLIARTLYDEYGISENALITELALPGVSLLVILLTAVLATRTCVAGRLDVVWYRRTRAEGAWAILLIIAVTALYTVTSVLIKKSGLPIRPDLWFWADQQGLAFFASLTILIVVLGPILEELFWRGYVQALLERVGGTFFACLVQAVLFAAIHLRPLGGFIPVFLFGLIVGAWRWRRRTLLPIILAHMAVNGLWCAARWPDWLDCTRIRPTHDYVAEFIELSKPADYDPNEDARYLYEQARQSAVKVPPEFDQVKDVWPTYWSAEQHVAISAWLSASEQALDCVEEGSQKPYYWPEVTGRILAKTMPKTSWIRSSVFALRIRSQLYAANGDLDAAFSDIVTCLRFADHFLGRRVLISQLVGFSIRASAIKGALMILENADVPATRMEEVQRTIEYHLSDDIHYLDFAAERLVFHEAIQLMFTDDGNSDGHIAKIALRIPRTFQNLLPEFSEQQKRAMGKLTRRQTTMLANKFFDLLDDAAKLTAWEFRDNTGDIREGLEGIMRRNAFISEFGEVNIGSLQIASFARTDLEALRATLAILRYDAEHGELPPRLQALVDEGYLKALPKDAFSSGTLIYRRTDGDFILYSFGADFDDDGGTPSNWGRGEQGGDQVFWPVQEPDADAESAAEAGAQ